MESISDVAHSGPGLSLEIQTLGSYLSLGGDVA